MTRGFLPNTDAALLAWSNNFSTLITATPTAYGLIAAQATAYAALHTAYATALAAVEPGVRNKMAVAAKNTARTNLKNQARLLASIVQGQATVTDAQKLELGLTVRAQPSPQPPPAFSPVVDIKSVVGSTVKVRMHGPDALRRGLPAGCDGIAIFSFVGAVAPTDPSAFKFEGNTTRSVVDITFPSSVAPGATVWICAMYFNERKQSGPACTPVNAVIQYGGAMAA